MIYNIARGNTTKARRTKEGEFEPEGEGEVGARLYDTAQDSEVDLSEESASDSEAECDTEPEQELGPDIW